MGSVTELLNDVISPHGEKQLRFIGLTVIAFHNSYIVIMSENID